jgi:hypothetical protein
MTITFRIAFLSTASATTATCYEYLSRTSPVQAGPHAQGEYLVFDMEDFKAHEKPVVLVSTKEVVQPSLNGLLLDLLQFKLVHLAKTTITKLNRRPKNSSAVPPAYQ